MRIISLTPKINNFQVGYLPESYLPEVGSDNWNDEKFIAVPLHKGRRRALVRCSLLNAPADGSSVILCDTRVQQIEWREKTATPSRVERGFGKEKGKRNDNIQCTSLHEKLDEKDDEVGGIGVGPPVLPPSTSKEEQMDSRKVGNISGESVVNRKECALDGSRFPATANTTCFTAHDEFYDENGASQESHQSRVFCGKLGNLRTTPPHERIPSANDYHGEIDLAHHIAEMEEEENDKHKRNCSSSSSNNNGGAFANSGKKCAPSEEQEQQLPSTVRFNDALACTSKNVQILKSGAIKMMRLTVICHSDLHYQNHSEKHDGNHSSDDSIESSYRETRTRTTQKESTTTLPSSTTRTTTAYSSSSSSFLYSQPSFEKGHGISKEESFSKPSLLHHVPLHEEKLDEKCISPSKTSTSSHQHSNQDVENPFTQSVTETGEKSKLFMKSFSPLSSSSSVKQTSGNWKRLENKIRSVFQTYDIHVTEQTLVDLKSCPLASIHTNLSPSVRFVYVEECEMRSNNTNDGTSSSPEVGRVTGRTEIIIANVHHISHYHRLLKREEARERGNSHLFGLQEPAKILHSVIIGMQERLLQKSSTSPVTSRRTSDLTEFSHGLLISGPSGCGKTVVVRETAKKAGASLLSFNPVVSVQEDVSRFSQQLTQIFLSAVVTASRYPTVLFFPRIHLLFEGRDKGNIAGGVSTRKRYTNRILHHLCSLFDSIPPGLALTVVGSTDKSFIVPLELRRAGRLEKEIIIYPPKESDRFLILQELCRSSPAFHGIDLQEVARQTPGYVAQDLLKLVRLALFKCQEEDCSQVSEHHVKYAVGRVLPSVLEGALGVVDIQRAVSLDHIAGLHSVKLDLIKAIVWPLNHPQSFLRMGISPPKGILLYGPPGNCKTTLVRALAASHHTNFLSVSAAELFSSGVGDSEKIVAHLFHRARIASPCILFIDELESIVGSRQSSEKKQTSTNESILSMLLTEMDGVGVTGFSKIEHSSIASKDDVKLGPLVLVVAATNRPDLIDPALLRPGRFDKLIGVPPLDQHGRLELLRFCSESIPFHSDVNFEEIAEQTEYYSGADLVNLCKEAAIHALTEDMNAPFVRDKHLKEAKLMLGPSLTPTMIRAFHEYGKGTTSV